jgi:hypothetical protein
MTSASHRCMTSARERTGGPHVAGSEWPPDARAPQPRAGGERLGGPRGTPQVATSSPAVGPRLQAHARESAHGKAATRCRRVGAGQRKARPRATAQERNRRAGDVALTDWLALVQRPRLRFCSVSRDPDSGFAPVHASRVRFSPGSLLHQLGEACPALLTRESPLGGRFGP